MPLPVLSSVRQHWGKKRENQSDLELSLQLGLNLSPVSLFPSLLQTRAGIQRQKRKQSLNEVRVRLANTCLIHGLAFSESEGARGERSRVTMREPGKSAGKRGENTRV